MMTQILQPSQEEGNGSYELNTNSDSMKKEEA